MSALPQSIKWRLQIYYGLILVAVLAGLGFAAYQLERNRLFHRLDDELHRRLDVVAQALHPPPRGPGPEEEMPPFDRPPPDENFHPRDHLRATPEMARLFDTNNPNQFFYVIQSRHGQASVNSSNPPDLREITRALPPGDTIRVGCSMAPERKELHLTAVKLTGVGGIILFFGLAGGAWLVSRALRPIESISQAAAKISGGDLSQRIAASETDSELGQLATVLNSTFARLEAAFAQQKQFTSDAAHELRTPVAVILTQTQTALTRERTAAEYHETVEACQRAAQRMRKLITALLELARLDAGQEQMNRLKFDLAQTARDCVELIRPLAAQRGIKIDCQIQPTECRGDSERLAQVITNLLANAIEYNHENGEVSLIVQPQNSGASLSVTNTGPGIAATDLPRLFERFYRADKSRAAGHNGLGLVISKAIIEAHSGAIDVSSGESGRTTFTVQLP